MITRNTTDCKDMPKWQPIRDAKQTTIVEVVDNKTKLRIERRSFSAQELI